MSSAVVNPYGDADLLSFLLLLFYRLPLLLLGRETLAHDELQIALLCFIGISCAIVGTFLVLRQMTMLANALSHTILLGIVAAFLITQAIGSSHGHDTSSLDPVPLLLASICMALVTTFLTQFLTHTLTLQPDASCGLAFTTLFALGIIGVTAATRNSHIGTELVFGNVDALNKHDLPFVFAIMLANLMITLLFFKEWTVTTFDRHFAASIGLSNGCFDYLIMVQTSLSLVSAFRAVGVLMVLAMLTAPVLTARLFSKRLPTLLLNGCAISTCCSILGVALSRHLLTNYGLAFSTAGLIVCLLSLTFFTCGLAQKLYRSLQTPSSESASS